MSFPFGDSDQRQFGAKSTDYGLLGALRTVCFLDNYLFVDAQSFDSIVQLTLAIAWLNPILKLVLRHVYIIICKSNWSVH